MREVNKQVEYVHALLKQSFDDALATAGDWFPNEKKDSLANIVKPLALSSNSKCLTLTFTYLGVAQQREDGSYPESDESNHYWYPMRLGEWIGWEHALDTAEPVVLPYRHRVRSDEEEMRSWMTTDIKESIASEKQYYSGASGASGASKVSEAPEVNE